MIPAALLLLLGLLCYGLYREFRAIDRALKVDVPPADPRPPGYSPQWFFTDYAAPCDTRRVRRRHIAGRLFYLAVAALSVYSLFTIATGAA